jgi:hypothetical protein
VPLPAEGRIVATNVMGLSHNIDQNTYEHILRDSSHSAATTTKHSTTAICHGIDIEAMPEERMVEGDDELYIQHYSHHIY